MRPDVPPYSFVVCRHAGDQLRRLHGNQLCFDLEPAEGGTTGQIIRFWHDDSRRQVLATGFDSWLQQFADDLHSGKYIFSNEYGVLSVEDAKELGELKED